MLDSTTLAAAAATYANQDPREILRFALREFSPDLAISFSGAEDVVLIDMAAKLGAPFRVFSLDTGRLHPETYQFIEKVRGHYGIPVEMFFPQPRPQSRRSCARRGCSRSTWTATRNAAASAKWSR